MRSKWFVSIAAVAAAAAGPLAAQGTFTGLGSTETFVTDMSADGSIVVGGRTNFGPAFRWTAAGGTVNIGGDSSFARISRDGKTIVCDAKDPQGIMTAAIWEGGVRWRNLGGLPNGRVVDKGLSSGYGVSGDGSVIVGLAWVEPSGSHAFRWDQLNGMVDLGALQKKSSRANAVSADGHVVAGWDETPNQHDGSPVWRGAIWWQGMGRLMNPFGWIGQAEAINDSGSVIVGRGHPASPRHAYRFTSWDGHVEDLGAVSRGCTPGERDQEDISIAYAVNDDSTVVVGASGWAPPLDAFIWTPATKMVKLSDYLTSRGVTGFERWTLVGALAVTPDGRMMAGNGVNPDGRAEGWIVKLQ